MRIRIGTEFTMQSYAVSALADCFNEFLYRIKIISGNSRYVGSSSLNILCSKSMKIGLERRIQSMQYRKIFRKGVNHQNEFSRL